MARIGFYSATKKSTTDETGTVDCSMKVPGTFNGLDGFSSPPVSGRYMKQIQLWTECGSPGDIVTEIQVEDRDQVLGMASAYFPEYPIIQRMCEDATEGATGGIGMPVDKLMVISPIDPVDSRGLQFIPSGLYLCSKFNAGDGASGKSIFVNYIWGKYFDTI